MKNSALILINLQIDFCSGGAMEIPKGEDLIPLANQLMGVFDHNLAVIDWHPANHISFAGNHPWRHIGQTMTIDGLAQMLFPFHCVKDSFGAHFYPGLEKDKITKVFQKGTEVNIDDYSSFFDADKRRDTLLNKYLKEQGVENLFLMGLGLEKPIKNSVIDALSLAYNTFIITDACRGWEKNKGDEKKAIKEMKAAGAKLVTSERLISNAD